jgi:hypothetical protein
MARSSSDGEKKRPLAGPPIACAIHLRITGLSYRITNVMQVNTFCTHILAPA